MPRHAARFYGRNANACRQVLRWEAKAYGQVFNAAGLNLELT